jgi:hypothetical protein
VSINRFDAAVDHNQSAIVDALRKVGAKVEIIRKPLDLLVGFNRRTYILEVKQVKGRISQGQEDFIREWPGDIACVVRSASEALAVIGCETRGVEVGPRVMTSPWLDGTGGGA